MSGADLRKGDFLCFDFCHGDLSGVNLNGADLRVARFRKASLVRANLTGGDLRDAEFREADLRGARLDGALLCHAQLATADLQDASLIRANLSSSNLVRANLEGADLTDCLVFGVSAWDVKLTGAVQSGLILSSPSEPKITVDSLEMAQFVYLLLNNQSLRRVIDTITSKTVLILGRFTPERKAVLDAIRHALHVRNCVPTLFNFEKPASRDLTETRSALAHMARFVIADITDARSVSQELPKIVEGLPSVPVQPILLSSQHEYSMFEHFRRYHWV